MQSRRHRGRRARLQLQEEAAARAKDGAQSGRTSVVGPSPGGTKPLPGETEPLPVHVHFGPGPTDLMQSRAGSQATSDKPLVPGPRSFSGDKMDVSTSSSSIVVTGGSYHSPPCRCVRRSQTASFFDGVGTSKRWSMVCLRKMKRIRQLMASLVEGCVC